MTDPQPQLSWADRFRGALLGGAVGDALGAGVRHTSTAEIQQWFGPRGVVDYLPVYGRRGAVTDLTQLTVFTLEGLLRAKAEGCTGLPTEFVLANHLRWLHTQGVPWEYAMAAFAATEPAPTSWLLERRELYSTRNPAGFSLGLLGRMAARYPIGPDGRPQPPVVVDGSADHSVLAAPAMVWSNVPEGVYAAGAGIANLYTSGANTVAASGLHADVLAQLIRGIPLWDAVTQSDQRRLNAAYRVAGVPADVRRTVHAAMFVGQRGGVPGPLDIDIEFDVVDKPGELGIALAAVGSTRNFADAVQVAVNNSADSAVTGALAGQLAGAVHGPGGIPRQWLDELELREVIETLCGDAAEAFAPPPPPQWAQRYTRGPQPTGPRQIPAGPAKTVEGSAEQTMVMPAIKDDSPPPAPEPPQAAAPQVAAPQPAAPQPVAPEPPVQEEVPRFDGRIGAPTFPAPVEERPAAQNSVEQKPAEQRPAERPVQEAETTAVFAAIGSEPEPERAPVDLEPRYRTPIDLDPGEAEEPEPEIEAPAPIPETPRVDLEPDPEPEPEPLVEAERDPEPEPEPVVDLDPEPVVEAADFEPGSASDPEPEPANDLEPEAAEPQTDLEPEVEPESDVETTQVVEVVREVEPESAAETTDVVEAIRDVDADPREALDPEPVADPEPVTDTEPVAELAEFEPADEPEPADDFEPADAEPSGSTVVDVSGIGSPFDLISVPERGENEPEPDARFTRDSDPEFRFADADSEPAPIDLTPDPDALPGVAKPPEISAEPPEVSEEREEPEGAEPAQDTTETEEPQVTEALPASGGRRVHAKSDGPRDAEPSLTERVLGCFLGGALGDALGSDLEFTKAAQITERFGPSGPDGLREAYGVHGAITDDTQMTLFTAEGLIRGSVAARTLGADDPLPEVQLAYQRWLHTQGVEWDAAAGPFLAEYPVPDGWLIEVPGLFKTRAPGKTIFRALTGFGDGKPAGSLTEKVNDSKGCGGVMRAAPVALTSTDPAEVFELAARTAAITHSHPAGYHSAGALAVIVQQALLGRSLDDGVWLALQVLETWDDHDETTAAIKAAVDLAAEGEPTPERIAEVLGGGWVGEQAVAIAVCAALVAGDDVQRALQIAVHHDGDSDSTGAICGNIVGALQGVGALPLDWLAELELRDVIEQTALDCVAEFGRGGFQPGRAAIDPPSDHDWNERYPVRPQWSAEPATVGAESGGIPSPKPAPRRRLDGVAHTDTAEGDS